MYPGYYIDFDINNLPYIVLYDYEDKEYNIPLKKRRIFYNYNTFQMFFNIKEYRYYTFYFMENGMINECIEEINKIFI